jgi:dynamin-binding protein
MSDSPIRGSAEDLPTTPADTEEPEVLFLAASLFEFNIAHDRREGGIPYLVYVPGEIFDVIGMKGELWLARNQDDHNKTVGWIWEKHFARILPEDP